MLARKVGLTALVLSFFSVAPSAVASTLTPFTIVTLPDTQNLSDTALFNNPVTGLPASLVGTGPGQEGLPANRITLFNAQTQWIASNQTSQNIQFVTHLGDIVQRATVEEFNRVLPVFARLDATTIPYSTVPGNHDYSPGGNGKQAGTPAATALANYVAAFGPDRYAGRDWYGGASPNGANSYQLFEANGRQYLHIGLEHNPNNVYNNNNALTWAQSVLNANPGVPTIISTHALIRDSLNPQGGNANINPSNPNAGQAIEGVNIYRDLIRNNDQIVFTFNGHYVDLPSSNPSSGERFEVTVNNAGRNVYTLLTDYQNYPNGSDGYLRNYIFDEANNKIHAVTYSPRDGANTVGLPTGGTPDPNRFFLASPSNPYVMPAGLPAVTSGTFQIDPSSSFAIDFDFASRLSNIAAPQAAPKASFTATGYQQNFDSMGDGTGASRFTSTEAPIGFRVFTLPGGNTTFTNATDISLLPASNPLASFTYTGYLGVNSTYGGTTPSLATNNNGLNAAFAATPLDRILATSPTGNAAAGIELQLRNNSGSALQNLFISYDIARLNAPATANELPGYQLFYSQDAGDTWTKILGLTPTLAGTTGVVVPNTIGVTNVSNFGFSLARSWGAGQDLYLRWIDDNADQTSPDQIIGLNNLSVAAAVPEPFTIVGTLLGGAAALRMRKRLKATNKL
jgi:hypothetical protein